MRNRQRSLTGRGNQSGDYPGITMHYSTHSLFRFALLLGACLLLAACGPRGRLASLDESVLRAELNECNNIARPSNSKAIACQNFRHECETRMDRDGKYRDC